MAGQARVQTHLHLSRVQLVVDAPHIYPSKNLDSNDKISNGFVLQPPLHRAMDDGLIYPIHLGPGRYMFRLYRDRGNEIGASDGFGGLKWLEQFVDREIQEKLLPEDPRERASPTMIQRGNKDRNILIALVGNPRRKPA